jgi:hypothetical protein
LLITCDEDEKFGSMWQKLLCRKLPGCPIEKQELFWKTKGMAEARKALNRKRRNTNNAMKREFVGKLNIIWSGEKQLVVEMCGELVLKPSQFALPCHSVSFHCGLLYCISLSELYRKGIELPDPEKMLGNLDKVGEDPNDGIPCLRASDAHAQFLFLFAKTVVVASVFKKHKTTRLLSS